MSDQENLTRSDLGKRASLVGLLANIALVVIKVLAGLAANSIAILADGMNNLGDAASAVITLVGFKIAQKPADKSHPYGHERAEYISGFVVSLIIIVVGAQFLIQSIEKIFNPQPVRTHSLVFILLLVSILVKVALAFYYRNENKKIESSTIEALALDSRNDALMTSVVAFAYVIESYFGLAIDGYIGILVALFILYSGISSIMEAFSELLGQKPDPRLIQDLTQILDENEDILGYHDLHIHMYGPGTQYASVHIEVPSELPLLQAHQISTDIEKKAAEVTGVDLVTHLDPLQIQDEEYQEIYQLIDRIFEDYRPDLDFHDLQFESIDGVQTLTFDVEVDEKVDLSNEALYNKLTSEIYRYFNKYPIHIDFDHHYILKEKDEE